VTGGTECIRMASRRLITSAYYYLGVCFNEAIPEFSPYDVEKIS